MLCIQYNTRPKRSWQISQRSRRAVQRAIHSSEGLRNAVLLEIGSRLIAIYGFVSRLAGHSHQTPEADVEGKIFLGGLTWQTSEEMLKTHFGKWGTLNDVILMRNKITGEPRGFGFVQFQDSSCGFALQPVPVSKRCALCHI